MQFFNFINEQTFHFFEWISESKAIDVPSLVAKAMEQVEGDEWFETGMDVSTIARDKLTEILEELLQEQLDVPNLTDPFEEIYDRSKPVAPLVDTLLYLSVNQICFPVVAEAILRKQGKWAPDKDIPEVK